METTVTGLGAYLPARRVTNEELSALLDTSPEWIESRTGIRTRHWADPGTATGDLALEAGGRAIKSAGLSPGDIDLMILATTTPDHRCPATAPDVAARLGLGPVAAYDVSAVCSGFLYALATAHAHITAGHAAHVLVVGAETYSTILDPGDRTTRVIFGDGAGALILSARDPDDEPGPGTLLATDLGSDGSRPGLIRIPGGGSREPAGTDRYFRMEGRAVFKQAVLRMGESARRTLARTGWDTADVDRLVGHQANVRILTALADHLGIPAERAVVDVDRVGNTSAASIPLALAHAAEHGRLTPGDRVLLTAFGGGLTWASAALTWPDVTPG
ncbi:3-oxoacyl-[acyl-carrier-protein] synthase 3 [Streptomyces sp. RB5]|uniref:Beta-ketoacyl-[acyl-carrier-protein] synthase III n=1 Tax=Streptomyces smaragdinus TaxID=2585196 RepID=A0A7K0CCY0_9ACTN|nr:beta-ketoacyl-ACP synthase III [Streptomyces smaragdinus]MQY11311.1 3-oxoacyl-[acyl-carrier-protein] synthase 3 [Streptomyces smaragdinus]